VKQLRLVIGSDHGGYDLKNHLRDVLQAQGYTVVDYGTRSKESCDYPDIAVDVAKAIQENKFDRGILLCGTGLGMAITANRFEGVRAISCSDCYSAKMSVEHNNANILALGQRVVGQDLAELITKIWLEAKFEGGRHERRIEKIEQLTYKSVQDNS
jgi:ribose 5-phosphate isomerase B